ncbi:hypothetical protein AgCh_000633 [Apium graveolens]
MRDIQVSAHTDTNTENLLARIGTLKEQLAKSQAEAQTFKAQVVEWSSSSTSINNQLAFIRNDISDLKTTMIPKLNSIQESPTLSVEDISNLYSIYTRMNSLEDLVEMNHSLDSSRFLKIEKGMEHHNEGMKHLYFMIKNSHCPNEEQRTFFEGPSDGGSGSGGKEKDSSAGETRKDDDVYYSREQDYFDIFDVPTEPDLEDKAGFFEDEEESNFEEWEEEAQVDPIFEKEFQQQQSELKRKEAELKKISQIIDMRKEIQITETLEKQHLHDIKAEARRRDVTLKIGVKWDEERGSEGSFKVSLHLFENHSLSEIWVLLNKVKRSLELNEVLRERLKEFANRYIKRYNQLKNNLKSVGVQPVRPDSFTSERDRVLDKELLQELEEVLRIAKRVNGLPESDEDAKLPGATSVTYCLIKLLVPSSHATNLIGKQGSTIKSIQESSGASIRVQLEFDQFGLHIYNANVKQLVDVPGYEYFSYIGQKTLRDAQILLEAETEKSAKQSSELNSLNEVVSCLKNELNFENGFQDELEVAVFELKSSKTTISELKQEKQDLKLSLEKKIEDSVKLESYIASMKESLKCLQDNLLVETGLKEKLECTVLEITSQLDEVQDKLRCFESLDAKMVNLRQLPSNLDIKRSQNNLSVQHKDCLEESSRPTGLSCQLAEIHEHVLAAEVTLTFIKTQYESLI